jgi:hypothetical protein
MLVDRHYNVTSLEKIAYGYMIVLVAKLENHLVCSDTNGLFLLRDRFAT